MNKVFLFDVDGTLTPPRDRMLDEFAEFFSSFVKLQTVFLVSGSDYLKIQEQVPQEILNNCRGVFGCSGAEYFEADRLVYRREHKFPEDLINTVKVFISQSPYDYRHGTHIEYRPGMLNISVVGRDATPCQRAHYHDWDKVHDERSRFAAELNEAYDGYEATCGGEISIDIVPAGWNKSVVKQYVLDQIPEGELVFFGDRMGPTGNDRPLAEVLNSADQKHQAIEVSGYKDTWNELLRFTPSEQAFNGKPTTC